MAYPENPPKSNVLDERMYRVRILGTGAANPTKQIGHGVTVTRTAEGVYKFTFANNPGTFINFYPGLGAATPGDVKGHTVTRDTPVAATATTNAYIELSVWDGAAAADDLDADEYLDVTFVYSTNSAVA